MKVFRVDRILEGAVGVQEYKNSVNPGLGHTTWRDIFKCVPRVDKILVLLNAYPYAYSAFQNSVNPEHFQRYASSMRILVTHK